MRSEIKEYNYDWLLWGVLHAAANSANGTEKEYQNLMKYIPYFRNIANTFVPAGKTGIEILKLFEKCYENILTAREQGKKLAITTALSSPAIFFAMDIVPMPMEFLTALGCLVWKRGMSEYLDYACQIGLPDTSCSGQRGALGAYFAELGESADFIVCNSSGSCDTNANAFAFASSYMDKPMFVLNHPSVIGDNRSAQYHVEEYKKLILFLEEQTGKKLDWDRMAEVLKKVDYQDNLTLELDDMHLMKPSPFTPLYTLGIYAGRLVFSGHDQNTQLLESMVEEGKERLKAGIPGLKAGEEKVRAFVCYLDHYIVNANFWNWFDERGISHMGGILTRNFRDNTKYAHQLEGSCYGIDITSPDTMLNSIAQMNATVPMVRSMRGPYDAPHMWLEESLVLAKMFQADCFIFNTTLGCRSTWASVKLYAREVEKHGYPVHIMNTDAFDDRVESWEMARERLDEFLRIRGLI